MAEGKPEPSRMAEWIADRNCPDTYVVGAILCGHIRVWDMLLADYEDAMIEPIWFRDRRLWSLAETLIHWRRYIRDGELKLFVPKIQDDKITGLAMRSAVREFLITVRMWGRPYTYFNRDEQETFEGWTATQLESLASCYERDMEVPPLIKERWTFAPIRKEAN